MNRLRTSLLAIALLPAAAHAQSILIDPAGGGPEEGARLADHLTEKQVTLSIALRLASMLRARGFAVDLTRSDDAAVTKDIRAARANMTRPIACVLLHASPAGTGVHIFTTALQQKPMAAGAAAWDEAQAPFSDASHQLGREFVEAFTRTRIPVSLSNTWLRPLDNMQCAAVAIEVAPAKDGTGADDRDYQTRIADTISGELLAWRGHAPPRPTPPAPPPPTPTPSATTKPPAATTATAKTPSTAANGPAAKPVTASAVQVKSAPPAVPRPAPPAVPKPTPPAVTKQTPPAVPKP